MDIKKDLISVCICTFKRPTLLSKALQHTVAQVTNDQFTYEIVVVDNDFRRSAEVIVSGYKIGNAVRIIYDCEPEQNIALARNKAVKTATGNLIAFIDDDERPVENWLLHMYSSLRKYSASAVLGPVMPDYPWGTPKWLKKSGLCNRPRHKTGSLITRKDMRTGNILFCEYVFEKGELWFDPKRGLSGGEDGEFISKQLDKGRKFIWCDEAIVYETVPENRWSVKFYLKRNYGIGTTAGTQQHQNLKIHMALKSLLLLVGYLVILPPALLCGKHNWIKIMIRIFYNAGFLFSFFRLVEVQKR
jgi:glycosyltransferase involved in cell wall biosynthesis